MKYSFPQPVHVPSEIKQTVMNHVFPQQKKLLKRASFVRIFSASFLFLGVLFLFSFLYFHSTSSSQDQSVPTKQLLPSLSSQEIDNIETTLVQAEQILSELDALI